MRGFTVSIPPLRPGVHSSYSNRGMDVSEALRLPGVADVITAADIPGQKVRMMFGYEEELLADSQVESESHHCSPGGDLKGPNPPWSHI